MFRLYFRIIDKKEIYFVELKWYMKKATYEKFEILVSPKL